MDTYSKKHKNRMAGIYIAKYQKSPSMVSYRRQKKTNTMSAHYKAVNSVIHVLIKWTEIHVIANIH